MQPATTVPPKDSPESRPAGTRAECGLPKSNRTLSAILTDYERAIHEKCRDCIFDPLAPGNWKQQTGACTITQCALWPFRPKSRPKKP